MEIQAPNTTNNLLDRLKQICVFIPGPGNSGTGYLIAPGRIATAYHVVKSWQYDVKYQIYVGAREHQLCKASLQRKNVNIEADAAVLILDDELDISPLPIAANLEHDYSWKSYGFPALANRTGKPAGIPIDGYVKDPKTENDRNQPAVLLFSPMIAAGNASPEHGFSGSPVVVAGAIVGHLVKHISDPLDIDRAAFGLLYACPIGEVLKLLDFEPEEIVLPSRFSSRDGIISGPGANEYYICYSLAFQELKTPEEDYTTIDITIPVIGLSDVFSVQLRRIVFQGGNSTNDYTLFDGERVSAATAQVNRIVQRHKSDLASLQAILNSIKSEIGQLETSIRSIESELPPQPPLRHVINPVTSSFSEEERTERQAWLDEDYRKRQHQWELNRKSYEQRQLSLPGLKTRRNQLQEQADTRQNEIVSFNQNFEARIPEFKREIDTARGKDIVHLLAKLRDSASQDLNEQALVTRGFAQLLVANVVYPISQPWLGASFDNAEKITREIKKKIEEAITSKYRLIGFDLLYRVAKLNQALQHNENNLNCITKTLSSLPAEELVNFSFLAQDLIRENNFEAVTPYNDIVNPEELNSITKSISQMRERVIKAQEQRQSLLHQTSEIFEKIEAARIKADSYRTKIQNVKNQFSPYLEEINLFWILLIKTKQDFNECKSLESFTNAIEKDVARRFDSPLSALIDNYIKTNFFVTDADQALNMHSSRIFIENRKDLVSQLSILQELKQKFDDALVDIQKVPDRICIKYRNYMRLYVIGTVLPFVNLLCAIMFVENITKLRPALCSSVSCYVSLRIFSKKIYVWIFGVSILIATLTFILLKFCSYEDLRLFVTAEPLLASTVPISYLLTAFTSLFALKKMR